jgi:hypothetical protein
MIIPLVAWSEPLILLVLRILLVVTDHYTAETDAMYCKSTQFAECAEWLYSRYGSKGVEVFHSDNGSPFISKLMKAFLRICKAKAAHGRPYNPRIVTSCPFSDCSLYFCLRMPRQSGGHEQAHQASDGHTAAWP